MAHQNVIVFTANDEGWAVDLRWVREVCTLGPISPIPRGPADLIGLVAVGGSILPILALHPGARAHPGGSGIVLAAEGVVAILPVAVIDEIASLAGGPGALVDKRGRRLTYVDPAERIASALRSAEAAGRKLVRRFADLSS